MKKKLVCLLVFLAALLICTVALADWQIETEEDGTYLTYILNGKVVTGTKKIDNVTYYFDSYGHLTSTGDVININGSVYFVRPDCRLATGWVETLDAKYFFDGNFRAVTGWQDLSDYFHYFEPNTSSAYYAAMVTGPRTIDGQLCNFNKDGILQSNNRTFVINGQIYALDQTGRKRTGWQVIDGNTYYFGDYYSDDGTSHIGFSAAIGGAYMMNAKEHFLFGSDGIMRTGLVTRDGKTYYYDPDSIATQGTSRNGCRYFSGWKTIAGNTYFFDGDGVAYTGSHLIQNGAAYDYYYFDEEGRMQTGRVLINGKIFYYDTTGKMQTGWYQPNGTDWYYLTTTGALTGLQVIRDDTAGTFDKYFFSDEGFLQFRWVTLNGRLYYFDPANAGKMMTGWQRPDGAAGNTYYFDPDAGYAVVGQQTLPEPAWTATGTPKTFDYLFSAEGKMQTGLRTIGGKIYYYSNDAATQGQRLNGWVVIDNAAYYFAPNALTNTIQKLIGMDGEEDFFEFDADGKVVYGTKTTVSFVRRCYELLLGRQADQGGLHNWVNQLRAGQIGAAQVVEQFVYSPEFIGQANANTVKVERLYETMLDRPSDPDGNAHWTKYLDDGCSEKLIINGFSWSYEFGELCDEYGITVGGLDIEPRDVDAATTAFVSRCYLQGLNRTGGPEELNYWCELMLRGERSPRAVAAGFSLSNEMIAKSTSDQVDSLYRLYLGREPDPDGRAYWLNKLNSGVPLEDVVYGFAYSDEFIRIMEEFGLR